MDPMTVAKEIETLERRYWQAIKERDVDTAIGLTDDQCIVAGAQGAAAMDRKTMAQMLNASTWSLRDIELSDLKVHLPSDDVAVVAYRVKEQMTVEGEPLTLEAADASTWVKRNGRWLCALHTESIAGDRFGRDRR